MYTEETFQGLVDFWGEKTPEREAIYDGAQRISYGELNKKINQLTVALSQLHIQKGDKVLTVVPNWQEFIVIFFAVSKVGAILVPCNIAFEEQAIRERLLEIKPKAVFVADQIQLTWLHDNQESYEVITVRFKEEGYLSFTELLGKGKNGEVKQALINPYEDVSTIMFTSGTTGCPKGVELTFRNLFHSARNIGYRLQCAEQDAFLVPMPCCHLFGIVTGILLPLYFGGKIVLMDKFSPQKVLDLIETEKVTVIYGVPTMFIRELQEYKQHKKDVSSLRTGIVAGAICNENLLQQICCELNCDVMVAYGSTETVSVSMTSFEDEIDKRSQTVGRVFDGVEVKVVNDNGQSMKSGEVGELVCRGYGVMKGYYQRPQETRQVLKENGWLHTGDLATVDQLGYIKIVGRNNDMIIRGGYNIYPAEVEEIYHDHPDVLEVCVLGISHEVLGEQTCACIQFVDNSLETAESIREYAIGLIAKYKIPDKVIVVKEMPKLENGKINKKMLLEYSKLSQTTT
jgi:fatty-acyl-CoA synthase/long-chain acyl-CoA synthetase